MGKDKISEHCSLSLVTLHPRSPCSISSLCLSFPSAPPLMPLPSHKGLRKPRRAILPGSLGSQWQGMGDGHSLEIETSSHLPGTLPVMGTCPRISRLGEEKGNMVPRVVVLGDIVIHSPAWKRAFFHSERKETQ